MYNVPAVEGYAAAAIIEGKKSISLTITNGTGRKCGDCLAIVNFGK